MMAYNDERLPVTLVGFNILAFDLPVLLRRSQYLGLTAPYINLDRYRTPHCDLMQKLSFNGALKFHSLTFYGKRFAVGVPDATKGSDIAALVQAENWAAVEAHCRADVETTAALAERLGLLTPQSLCFDLETAAIDDAADYIEAGSAPTNYKDPEKIAAYVAEAKAAAVSKCALDPDLCRVVALGYRLPDGSVTCYTSGDSNERDIIEDFWRVYRAVGK